MNAPQPPPSPRPSPNHPASTYLRRRRRRRTRLLLAACGALLTCIALSLILLYLLRQPPAFYREYEQSLQQSPAAMGALAERVERRVLAALEALPAAGEEGDPPTGADGSQPEDAAEPTDAEDLPEAADGAQRAAPQPPAYCNIYLTVEEANAWLTTRFDDWMAFKRYSLPPRVTAPAIGIKDGNLKIGFRYVTSGFSQVFSATCRFRDCRQRPSAVAGQRHRRGPFACE